MIKFLKRTDLEQTHPREEDIKVINKNLKESYLDKNIVAIKFVELLTQTKVYAEILVDYLEDAGWEAKTIEIDAYDRWGVEVKIHKDRND